MPLLRRLLLVCLPIALLFAFGNERASAGPRDLSAYTLKVHIYQNHWSGGECCGYHGYGRANLLEGAEAHGMEYTFSCLDHFMASDADQNYPAKWKKPGQSIEMVMGVIGSPDKTKTCELKVSLKDSVYIKENGDLHTISIAEWKERQANHEARKVALAPDDTDGAHYPLRLSVLSVNWGDNVAGMRSGSGHGNLKSPDGLSSVDFSVSCPVRFEATPEGRSYAAKWTEQGSAMTILMHKLGEQDAAAVCQLKTTVHKDVYVRAANGELKAVSAEAYKQMKKSEAAAATAP